jgi:hypothetical protein
MDFGRNYIVKNVSSDSLHLTDAVSISVLGLILEDFPKFK